MINKSVQYSMFCENWMTCNQFEDYQELTKPVTHYRGLGYKKIKGRWYCSGCAAKLKSKIDNTKDNNQ